MCKQRLVLNVQSMKIQGTIVGEKSLHAPRAAERRVLTIDNSRQCIVNDNEPRVVLKDLIHHLLSLIPIHNINLDSLDRELCISPGSTTSCYTFGNQLKTCCYGCFCLTHLPCAAIHLIHLVSKAFSHEEHRQPSAITTQCSKPRSSKPRPRKPRSSLNPSKTPVLNQTKTSKGKGMYHDWYSGAEEAGSRITAAIRGRRPSCIPSSPSSSSSSCGAAPSQKETQRVASLNTSSLPCAATKKSPEKKLLVRRR